MEYVNSEGWALDQAASRGAEVLIFDPRQDDPPSFFTYLADGKLQLHLELGLVYEPVGAQPGLLRPVLEASGVIPPEDSVDDLLGEDGEDEELSPVEEKCRVLKVVGEHFGLSLPREVIESGQLPAAVIRTSPPSSW